MAEREAILSVIVDEWGGMHPGAWRHPDAPADPAMDLARVVELARTAERGKFHALFLADNAGLGMVKDLDLLSGTANLARFEPFTLMAALSQATEHIGLALTASTTYNNPFTVARMFASLDHLSGGRAAWNVVTSNADTAPNFNGLTLDRAQRYERAAEFFDVVAGLWDNTVAAEDLPRDKASGRFFTPGSLRSLNHHGAHFDVAGPLNITRPPQGRPIIAQAGSSPEGMTFAARAADVFFVYGQSLDAAQELYREIKGRVGAAGRDPDDVKVLPSLSIVLGSTTAEAEAKLAQLDELADIRIGVAQLGDLLGTDVSGYELDAPVPDLPRNDYASQTMQDYYLGLAKEQGLTLRQLAQISLRFDCTPMSTATVADHIESYVAERGADGFNVSFSDANGSLDLFVDEVVPELQRRGVFHREYRGTTLRDSLGLTIPVPTH